MPGSAGSMHLEYVLRDVQSDRHNLCHGRLLHRPGFLSHLRSFNGYDGPEILPSSTRPFCLISADAGQGVQVIAPGGYVREHSHTPNQEILFCFEGKGTVLVDGVPHPFVPGTTVYAGPGVRHKIINDGPGELKMTWTYLPPGLDDFFAAIGRPRNPGAPAPEPFARPAEVHAIEARSGYGPPLEG